VDVGGPNEDHITDREIHRPSVDLMPDGTLKNPEHPGKTMRMQADPWLAHAHIALQMKGLIRPKKIAQFQDRHHINTAEK